MKMGVNVFWNVMMKRRISLQPRYIHIRQYGVASHTMVIPTDIEVKT
jgi:hypothetical protein